MSYRLSRKRAAYVFWALLLTGAGLLLLLHLDPIQRVVFRLGIARLQKSAGVTVTASDVSFNLITGTAEVRNLTIRSGSEPDLPPLVAVRAVAARLRTLRLGSGLKAIADIRLQDPAIQVVRTLDGRSNLPDSRSSQSADWSSLPAALTAEGGSLRFDDAARGLKLHLPRWRLTLARATEGHDVSFASSAAGNLGLGQRSLPIEDLLLSGRLASGNLEVASLRAGLGVLQTEVRGRVTSLSDPVLDLRSTTHLSLSGLLKVIGAEPISGELLAAVNWRGRPGRVTAEGSVEASGVSYGKSGPWSARSRLRYDQAGSRLELTDLSARSTLGSLQASGTLSLQQDRGDSFLDISTRDLDLAKAMAVLGWKPVIASRVSGTARASWKGLEWRKASAHAELSLAPRDTGGELAAATLGGSATFDGNARGLTIRLNPVSGPGFLASGQLRLAWSGGSLDGALSGAVTDITAFLDAARRSFPGTIPESSVPLSGSVRWRARLAGSSVNPRVTATIESASVDLGQLTGIGIAGPVEYDSGLLRMPDTLITWRRQAALMSGEVNLQAEGSPEIRIEAEMNRVSLTEVLSGLGRELPLAGLLSGHLTGRGTFARPEMEGQLLGEELAAWGEALGTLTAAARMTGSELKVDELRLEKPQKEGSGTAVGSGQLDWERDRFRFQAKGERLRLESTILPGGLAIGGVLSVEAAGEGSLSDPQLSARIGITDLKFAGNRIGDVQAVVEARGAQVTLSAEAPGYPASLKGEVRLEDPFPAHLVLDAPDLDVGRLAVSLRGGELLTGSASVHVEGEGPLARPGEIAAKATVRDLELRAEGRSVRSRSPIELEWSGQALRLLPVTLVSDEAALDISGTLPLNSQAVPGEISLGGTASLPGIIRLVPGTKGFEAKGIASVRGTVRGSFEKPDPSLEITVGNGELRIPGVKAALTSLAADLSVNADGIEARRFEARLGEGSVRLTGLFPFSVLSGGELGEFARGTAQLERIDPGAILEKPARLGGSISAHVDIEARRADLKSLRSTIRFSELELRAGEVNVAQAGESRLRMADGRLSVDQFELKGPNTELRVSGSVDLTDRRTINLKLSGAGEARLLSATGSDYGLTGPLELNLDVGGTLDKPSIQGNADVRKGRFFLGTPQVSAEDLNAHAEFMGRRVTLTRLTGQVNGGQLQAMVSLTLGQEGMEDLSLKATGRNIFLDYPRGLRTVSHLDLGIRSEGSGFIVEGTAELLEGEHREAINARTFQQTASGSGEAGNLLERIRFDVKIKTIAPLSVDNNLARVDAYADVRLGGTAARPALLGRLELDEGGRIYISERVFSIVRAVINFNSEKAIEPSIELNAQTRIADYTVTYRATGGLKDLESSWSSDPAASQEQIFSLLLTGSVNNTDKISSADMMSRQAFSLFGSTMMGGFNVRLRRAFGFSEFRIEPSLISADSDPTARLTVGQNLTPDLRLTYSANLTDSNDQIWIVEYDWRRMVLARYVNQTEDSDRGSLLHKVRFGGGPGTGDMRTERRGKQERLESLEVSGNLVFPEEVVKRELKLNPGSKYDFLKVQDRLKRLSSFYVRKGYLESRIRQERERGEQKVRLKLEIHAGPRNKFAYEGAEVPESLQKQVREAWRSGFVDAQRLQAAAALIRQHLFRERYCEAIVKGRVESQDGVVRSVKFTISPGPRYRRVETVVDGLEGKLADDMRSALRRAKLDAEAGTNPEAVRRLVARELRDRGFLGVAVDAPRVERNPEAGTFASVIPVRPGPAYRLGRVQFEGNRALTEKDLLSESKLRAGREYLPAQREAFAGSVESLYWKKGYRDVVVESTEEKDAGAGTVDLIVRIQENARSVIAGIAVEGNVETSEAFLRRRIPLSEGSPVDGEKVSLLRRRLTNPGTYNVGDLSFRPSQAAPGSDASRPVDLVVRVREPKPFSLDYGPNYDSETGAGVLADFNLRNVLGEGRLLGYRVTADAQRRDHRIYFSQPFLGRRDITTTIDLERERQFLDRLEFARNSLTLQQLIEFRRKFTFSYGYRYRRAEGSLEANGEVFPFKGSVTPLISTLSRDSRDDVFDATGGSYISQSLEYGPRFLGGSYAYYRYFGQFFKYFGLTHPARVPSQQEERPRVVFATGVRVGFLDGIGGEMIIPSERFFGGGSSTVRGFSQNSLGPQLGDQPLGGQAVVFLNNELRFPLYKFLDAAVFVDMGNVWAMPSRFSLADVRKTAGFGLRLRNPLILLRFDYGWKLDRRPGESSGAFHFGLGQAY